MDQSIKRAAYEIGLIFPLNRHRHGRGYRYRRRPCHLAGNGTTHWRIGFISSSDGWKMHRLLAVRIKRVEMSCRGFLPPSLLSDPPPSPLFHHFKDCVQDHVQRSRIPSRFRFRIISKTQSRIVARIIPTIRSGILSRITSRIISEMP